MSAAAHGDDNIGTFIIMVIPGSAPFDEAPIDIVPGVEVWGSSQERVVT